MFSFFDYLAYVLLGLSFLSLWVRRDPRIWGTLLSLSIFARMIEGKLLFSGLIAIILWALLWIIYIQNKNKPYEFLLFILLLLFGFGFSLHLLPGFVPTAITQNFRLGFESLFGLFPLALFIPLAKNKSDWKKVIKSALFGLLGIIFLAFLALITKTVHFQFKLPSYPVMRYLNNFIFVSMPEEAFFRGFILWKMLAYLKNIRWCKSIALLLSSFIFTCAHIYWAPTLDILGFVFLASLLYGGVYLLSEKIESAILTHFLLNFAHMTFFFYHAT